MSDTAPPPLDTRITRLLGVDYPIVQAPMGWIARAQLASAVSNAGGLGIIETSSGELDAVREEIRHIDGVKEALINRLSSDCLSVPKPE